MRWIGFLFLWLWERCDFCLCCWVTCWTIPILNENRENGFAFWVIPSRIILIVSFSFFYFKQKKKIFYKRHVRAYFARPSTYAVYDRNTLNIFVFVDHTGWVNFETMYNFCCILVCWCSVCVCVCDIYYADDRRD